VTTNESINDCERSHIRIAQLPLIERMHHGNVKVSAIGEDFI
jgi:hypothetical protein